MPAPGHLAHDLSATGRRRNWAGNVVFGAQRFHRPGSLSELQELVRRSDAGRRSAAGTCSAGSPTPQAL